MTTGIIIGVVSVLAASLITFAISKLWYKYESSHPFKIYATPDPIEYKGIRHRKLENRIEISNSQAIVHLVIQLKQQVAIDRFWLMFTIDKKKPTPTAIPRESKIIEITALENKSRLPSETTFNTESDHIGIDGICNPPYSRTSNEAILLEIIIEVYSKWRGHLAFCSHGRDGKRHYAYIDVETKLGKTIE